MVVCFLSFICRLWCISSLFFCFSRVWLVYVKRTFIPLMFSSHMSFNKNIHNNVEYVCTRIKCMVVFAITLNVVVFYVCMYVYYDFNSIQFISLLLLGAGFFVVFLWLLFFLAFLSFFLFLVLLYDC